MYNIRQTERVIGARTLLVQRELPTVGIRVNHLSTCNQPPRSTQPGHPSVRRRNEYKEAPLKSFDILALYKFDYYYYYTGESWDINKHATRIRGLAV